MKNRFMVDTGVSAARILAALTIAAVTSVAPSTAFGATQAEPVEEAGNNLSVPLVFGDGIGLAGADVELDPANSGLRGLPGVELFDGAFWYWWPIPDGEASCNPSQPGCPPSPAPAGLEKVYVQADADNQWQAEWVDGRDLQSPVTVDAIDWGDNLESQVWNTQSMVRTEVALYKNLVLTGYQMRFLAGQGQTEIWGTNRAVYEGTNGTVFSPCARLTIQKLQREAGSISAPPAVEKLAWDAAKAEWKWTTTGAIATAFNSAVWQRFGVDGPTDAYSAEVNVSGKTIFGYLWSLSKTSLPQDFEKAGWYRLTFSLDGTTTTTATPKLACGSFTLNTSVRGATIVVPIEEESVVADLGGTAAEPERPSFTPVVDAVNNLTYLDLYIEATQRGGGVRPIQNPGKGKGPLPVVRGRR